MVHTEKTQCTFSLTVPYIQILESYFMKELFITHHLTSKPCCMVTIVYLTRSILLSSKQFIILLKKANVLASSSCRFKPAQGQSNQSRSKIYVNVISVSLLYWQLHIVTDQYIRCIILLPVKSLTLILLRLCTRMLYNFIS